MFKRRLTVLSQGITLVESWGAHCIAFLNYASSRPDLDLPFCLIRDVLLRHGS